MRALVFDGKPHIADVPEPSPVEGEALVRVRVAGICNTDLEILKGYMGFEGIPGHEFAGIVEQASNPHLKGRRVVGEINCVCGGCHFCHAGMPNHCMNRTVLGIQGRPGAFAEYLTLPEANLHMVPDSAGDDIMVFTEPTAAAFRILEQIEVTDKDRVVVLGDGKLGQLVAQTLWLRTKRLVCVGKHAWKLALLDRLHITTACHDDPVEPGADIVVEATGSPSGLTRAIELVRPEGTIVLKTTTAQTMPVDLSVPVVNEVRLIGSRCGPFRPALNALALGNVEVRPMITGSYGLSEGVRALERAAGPDAMKVLIHME